MNIAILIPTLDGGGAERVAQQLGDYYVDKGNKVYYFIESVKKKQAYPVKGEIVQINTKGYLDGNSNDTQRMIKLLLLSLKVRKLKHQYKIDAAISFMEAFNYLNILSKGKEKVITRVCTILSKRDDLDVFLGKKSVVRFFYSRADKVIVMSRYALNDMHCCYGIPLKKLLCIPNFTRGLKTKESGEGWIFGTKAVVCVGRLGPVKQQERIIRAFSYACQKEPCARLIILGKGPLEKYLKHLCKRLQIEDSVVFVGFTDNVSFYLKNARVFVMASKVEGFPNSMIEAMYYGVPVITTDSPGGCGEIVKKPEKMKEINSIIFCKYGILTPAMPEKKLKNNSELSEQEKILGKAILKVLTEDEVYEKYRRQSLKRAEKFQEDNVMRRWNSIIEMK